MGCHWATFSFSFTAKQQCVACCHHGYKGPHYFSGVHAKFTSTHIHTRALSHTRLPISQWTETIFQFCHWEHAIHSPCRSSARRSCCSFLDQLNLKKIFATVFPLTKRWLPFSNLFISCYLIVHAYTFTQVLWQPSTAGGEKRKKLKKNSRGENHQ